METLPTTSTVKRGGRSKGVQTSKPSLVMAFFSCVAWLYVAGRSLSLSPFFHHYVFFFIKISLLTQFGSHFCWKHTAALSRFVNLQFDSSEFLLFVFELWSEISNLTDSVFYFCFFWEWLGCGKMQRTEIYLLVFWRRTQHRFFSSFSHVLNFEVPYFYFFNHF